MFDSIVPNCFTIKHVLDWLTYLVDYTIYPVSWGLWHRPPIRIPIKQRVFHEVRARFVGGSNMQPNDKMIKHHSAKKMLLVLVAFWIVDFDTLERTHPQPHPIPPYSIRHVTGEWKRNGRCLERMSAETLVDSKLLAIRVENEEFMAIL